MSTKYSLYYLVRILRKRFEKYINSYLDTRVIFAIDIFLSFVASALTILFADFFSSSRFFYSENSLVWLVGSVVYSALATMVFKCYKSAVRHTSIQDFPRYVFAVLTKEVLLFLTMQIMFNYSRMLLFSIFADFCITIFFIMSIRTCMVLVYSMLNARFSEYKASTRVFVCGKPDKMVGTIARLHNSPHIKVVGALSKNDSEKDIHLGGIHIYTYNSTEVLDSLIGEMSVSGILFASEKEIANYTDLIDYCSEHHLKTLVVPSIDEITGGKERGKVRDIKIEDLLGREEINISMKEIQSNFKGKVVMVTGAAGSIGSELCRQLAGFGVQELILFDNAETPMHNLRLELEERFPYLVFEPVIGDVRQDARLDYVMEKYRPQVVFHAAAYKHVPLMEENPCEAILVNVTGTRQVAECCVKYGVEKMVMISTDKAVNPTNIMGCSKRLAEIYVQSLGLAIQDGTYEGTTKDGGRPITKFVTTRFGNVLGSNGSVIPRFREQIEKGGPVTVTHPDITRFFMTIPEACRLVMEAATMGKENQIFVFDMGVSVKIDTLARRMIYLAGFVPDKDIQIAYTGLRPGEKLYEEVLAKAEETQPTHHDRIRIANVREYNYADALAATDTLKELSIQVNIPKMVMLMKEIVPEFKSKNSEYEKFD